MKESTPSAASPTPADSTRSTRNKWIVTLFLFGVIVLTGLLTFYVGPKMMAVRTQVAQDRFLYKCQAVVSGDTLTVQLRGWERPNKNPEFNVTLSGINVPPPGDADDLDVTAWANANGISTEKAALIGTSAHQTLLAFIRKQNLFLYREDGGVSSNDLPKGSRVHAFVSGSHVNLKLLEDGLALHDTRREHAHFDKYAAAEKKARAEKRGLWGL